MRYPATIATTFKVIDRPYVIWSSNPHQENIEFLDSIDHDFYHRTVQTQFCDDHGNLRVGAEKSDARKDIATLARLIWNHGLETLVTLLGAYVQAPHAVHGFSLKCENKDCRKIANYLLSGHIPQNNCLTKSKFNFDDFVCGIHLNAVGINDEATMSNFSRALSEMLVAYDRDDHRAEYNSIKHGLRAHHGRFAMAIGLQKEGGVPAPDENMRMMADTPDGSHFLTIKNFKNIPNKTAREQFSVQGSSVGWSLERTLQDIQLFSIFIGNIVAALKVAVGATPTVQFFRPVVEPAWWDAYFAKQRPIISNFSFGEYIEIPSKLEDAEKQAAKFYRAKASARKQANDEAN